MTKTQRHRLIRQILKSCQPLTREQLREQLADKGIEVSDKTLRRDEDEMLESGELAFASPDSQLMKIS